MLSIPLRTANTNCLEAENWPHKQQLHLPILIFSYKEKQSFRGVTQSLTVIKSNTFLLSSLLFLIMNKSLQQFQVLENK